MYILDVQTFNRAVLLVLLHSYLFFMTDWEVNVKDQGSS